MLQSVDYKYTGRKGYIHSIFKTQIPEKDEITPEDKVVAAAQILTQTIKGNVTGESEEMEALKKVADIFETIANRKSQKQE